MSQRERALMDFALWLELVPHAPVLRGLVMNVEDLNMALEAYGRSLFRYGRSRGVCQRDLGDR